MFCSLVDTASCLLMKVYLSTWSTNCIGCSLVSERFSISVTDGMKHETNSNDSGVFVKLRVVLTF